ncbi:MAG TPA: hypothetical protein VGM67_19950 [Gemmatimonadaceae bacterium]|jgi:hypothetical protein
MSQRPHRLRDFTDRTGVPWRVCEMVRQNAVDARPRERRAEPRSAERAFATKPRPLTRPADVPWLCFESRDERRRVSPAPDGWHDLPDVELEDLLGTSQRMY